jgi:hypothetical protein
VGRPDSHGSLALFVQSDSPSSDSDVAVFDPAPPLLSAAGWPNSCHPPEMDSSAPERVSVARARSLHFDRATLLFAAVPAPILGAALTLVSAVHDRTAFAYLALVLVAPGSSLVFGVARGVSRRANLGYAVLALALTPCWIALAFMYMAWEIGNDWGAAPD